jgi:hypothetical protein
MMSPWKDWAIRWVPWPGPGGKTGMNFWTAGTGPSNMKFEGELQSLAFNKQSFLAWSEGTISLYRSMLGQSSGQLVGSARELFGHEHWYRLITLLGPPADSGSCPTVDTAAEGDGKNRAAVEPDSARKARLSRSPPISPPPPPPPRPKASVTPS